MKLNLECGKDIKLGFVNIDNVQHDFAYIVNKLKFIPHPFDNNSATDLIKTPQVLEHWAFTLKTLNECNHILKPNEFLYISAPKKNKSSCSLYHKKLYTENSLKDIEKLNLFNVIRINMVKFFTKKEIVLAS